MESKKLSEYNSILLASQIERIKEVTFEMDMEYLQACADKLISQASFQDSAAVLNPAYDPNKSDLLRVQGKALKALYQFVYGLKECQKIKDEIAETDKARDEISKLFL